jgi:glycerate kinase
VETRLVCGLGLLTPVERQPLVTSTRGVGTVVERVAESGATHVYLGLGGSATVDGGLGMARAWGWEALDASGAPLPDGGGSLVDLVTLRAGRRAPVSLTGLADVINPLTGERGARVYARQKGASPEAVERLTVGLERLATVSAAAGPTGAALRSGAGAAGGLGFGILQFGQGELVSGAGWVLDRLGLAQALSGARAVVVGEGAFDRTSLEGKLTGVVLTQARAAGVPAVLLAPSAEAVPADVVLESGQSPWDLAELERRAMVAIRRALRLLAS